MRIKCIIVILVLSAFAVLADNPIVWIVSVSTDASAHDKAEVLSSIRAWVGQGTLAENKTMSHKRAKGSKVRWFAFWHDWQLSKAGALTQGKIDTFRTKLDNPADVTITMSFNPCGDCDSAGWTNIVSAQ